MGLSLADVAERTRVSHRQLEAVEQNNFSALPGTPYAVGFARAYARAVGADEVDIARRVREELSVIGEVERYEVYEPTDPARIPPRRLAWAAAGLVLLLAIVYGVWRTQFFSASTDEEISALNNRVVAAQPDDAPAVEQAPASAGPVVLTAVSDVWLRIYDQAGERLLEKTMAKGETFTVPPEANNPMILTGRPDAISVTVGGKPVPPLGAPERTISDVPVSAAALLARPPSGQSSGTGAGTAVPATAGAASRSGAASSRAAGAGSTAGASAAPRPASAAPSSAQATSESAPQE